MYRSSVLFLATFAVFVGNSAESTTTQDPLSSSLIVGGQDADISDYPYMVSVRLGDRHNCGGTIISDNVVLTAAHCINNRAFTEKDYSVQYSLTSIGGSENSLRVKQFIVNDKYRSGEPDYDIGLIILASDIPLAQPISLATVRPAAGTNGVITGWGKTDQDEPISTVLQSATVQIISNQDCQNQYTGIISITDRMLCAGTQFGDKDHCQGDSGGPLVVDEQLVGIISGGYGCGDPDYYGVYSDVASLRDWILESSL